MVSVRTCKCSDRSLSSRRPSCWPTAWNGGWNGLDGALPGLESHLQLVGVALVRRHLTVEVITANADRAMVQHRPVRHRTSPQIPPPEADQSESASWPTGECVTGSLPDTRRWLSTETHWSDTTSLARTNEFSVRDSGNIRADVVSAHYRGRSDSGHGSTQADGGRLPDESFGPWAEHLETLHRVGRRGTSLTNQTAYLALYEKRSSAAIHSAGSEPEPVHR
jgi:hypothetical protein